MERRDKLTPTDISAVVTGDMYFNPTHTTLTVCVVTTKNGGTVVGQSACVSPENFDVEIGRKLAFENATNQLWQLEGYCLLDRLANRDSVFEAIAAAAHEANAAYCRAIGDHSHASWDDAPQWQRDSAINGVKMQFNNPDASPRDSHESWLAEKEAGGWKWGEVKDPEARLHPCMVPYDDLPPEQQAKDAIFVGVVKTLIARLK